MQIIDNIYDRLQVFSDNLKIKFELKENLLFSITNIITISKLVSNLVNICIETYILTCEFIKYSYLLFKSVDTAPL